MTEVVVREIENVIMSYSSAGSDLIQSVGATAYYRRED